MRRLDPFGVPLTGTRLIEANAGTGKTYTIATLYVRLLLERALHVDQILVVTYTNAATAELRRTIRERVAGALAALRSAAEPTDAVLAELARRRRAEGTANADCARLEAALAGFDCAAIHTIHGFAQRVLQEHAFETGAPFDAEAGGDARLLIDEIVEDFWSRELYAAPAELVRFLRASKPPVGVPRLGELARLAATHPALRILPERPEVDLADVLARGGDVGPALARRRQQLEIDLVAYARAELRRRSEADGRLSFDDLLQRLAVALDSRQPSEPTLAALLRTRFPAALVDEFQDTDPIQYAIFRAVYGTGGTLFLIGDPKQAIYGFRGADVLAYLRAKRSAAADAVYTLDVNRRASPSLVRAINTLFSRASDAFVFPDLPFRESAPALDRVDALAGAAAGRAPLRILFAPREGRPLDRRTGRMLSGEGSTGWLHSAVAAAVAELLAADTRLGDRRVLPADLAVLCRTNRQTAGVQAALRAAGVPSVLQSDASVFDTPEAGAVERVVRALADPGDGAALTAALITPIVGLTGDTLHAARTSGPEWDAWAERFHALHDAWVSSGFTAAFRRLLDTCNAPERLLGQTGGERTLTNIFHLAELLEAAAADARRGPLGLVEWLQRMRLDSRARSADAAESAQIRLESDVRAVQLVTIHKSKGLQYPVVICPFVWEGKLYARAYNPFHADDAEASLTVDLRPEAQSAAKELADGEASAEQVRLLYVAVTRAQQLCLLVWGQFATCEASPLASLLHRPTGERPVAGLSDAEMRGDLAELAAASGGAIEVVDCPVEAPQPYRRPAGDGARLRVRRPSRDVRQRWRMTSFSALTAGERELPEPAAEGRDRDETAAGEEGVVAALAVRGFPRGRRLGTLVHEIFETIDFTAADAEALRGHTRGRLAQHGIALQWTDALADAVGDVLDTPLPSQPPVRLRDVPLHRRLNELEFIYPVVLEPVASAAGLSAAGLADVLKRHGPPWLAEYSAQVRRLPLGSISGYLRGYIDLVFEHGGRWFVVDYKTNDRGPRVEDYRPAALLGDMQRHHYVLQYHLYVVAVHRYLQQRLAGYQYGRDFGGAFYLYVRGMAPRYEPGCGVFFDRPDESLIRALSEFLESASVPRNGLA